MSDYVTVEDKDGNPVPLAGDIIAGVFYPRSKVVWGANDAVNDASAAAPLPISDAGGTLSVDDGGAALTIDAVDGAIASIGAMADAESASGNGSLIALLKRLRTLLSDDGGYYVNGVKLTIKRAVVNVPSGAASQQIIAAVTNKALRVLALAMVAGGTATDITFKSASTAISPLFANDARGGVVLGKNELGWFETATSEALNATASTGSVTGVIVTYVEV